MGEPPHRPATGRPAPPNEPLHGPRVTLALPGCRLSYFVLKPIAIRLRPQVLAVASDGWFL